MRIGRGGAPVNASTEVATSRSANAAGLRSAIILFYEEAGACVNVRNLQIFPRRNEKNRKRPKKEVYLFDSRKFWNNLKD